MPYVNVPNDLSKIKTKIACNLTKRQLICFGIGGLPLGVAPCGKQTDLRVAPRPEAQSIKPAISLLVLFQPHKGHGLVVKAPCLDKPQGLRELRECCPHKKCAVRGRDLGHRQRT